MSPKTARSTPAAPHATIVALVVAGVVALTGAVPAFALPPSGFVVWASNREDGRHEIFRMGTDGEGVIRLTYGGGKVPAWSPDGRYISYHVPTDGSMHVMHGDGSDDRQVCDGAPVGDGVPAFWMLDGRGLVCTRPLATPEGDDLEFTLVNPDSGETLPLFRKNDFAHLVGMRFEPGGITRDLGWLVGWAFGLYRGGYEGDNGVFDAEHSTVALDLFDPSRVYFFGPGCLSALSPTSDEVFHVSRAGPTLPDIFVMSMSDLMDRSSYRMELGLADADLGHEYMPAISNDGRYMVYAASLGCHAWYECDYEIFIHEVGAGVSERRRLTDHPANDNFPSVFIGDPAATADDGGTAWPDGGPAWPDARPGRPDANGAADAADPGPGDDAGCTCATPTGRGAARGAGPWNPAGGGGALAAALLAMLQGRRRRRSSRC